MEFDRIEGKVDEMLSFYRRRRTWDERIRVLKAILCLVVVVLVITAAAMDNLSDAPPTLTDRMYFVATTLSSVGFGDLAPKTGVARGVITGGLVCLFLLQLL